MNKSNFFSSNHYLFLPTRNDPKVALAVDSCLLSKKSFKLYNPFSASGKLLKKICYFSFYNFNFIFKLIFAVKKDKGDFMIFLEKKLNRSLTSSLYFSTIKDKIVIQLKTSESEIIGYLKYPLNKIGIQHIESERNAIDILNNNKIIDNYLLYDNFNGLPFILLSPLEGEITEIGQQELTELLLKFIRKQRYTLTNHPRIIGLIQSLKINNLQNFIPLLQEISKNSIHQYNLVYEHGDFTPWNIIKVDNSYVPFDFEYFVADGIEYFDLIKYYYQIGRLLNNLNGKELFDFIATNINELEINKLIQLFLIKEILIRKEHGQIYDFEEGFLETIINC